MYNIWTTRIRVNTASRKASKELSVAPAAQDTGEDVVMGAVDPEPSASTAVPRRKIALKVRRLIASPFVYVLTNCNRRRRPNQRGPSGLSTRRPATSARRVRRKGRRKNSPLAWFPLGVVGARSVWPQSRPAPLVRRLSFFISQDLLTSPLSSQRCGQIAKSRGL